MVKFNQVRKRDIVYCIVNDLDQCDDPWAKSIVINLTDYMISGLVKLDYDVFIGDNDQLLLEATVNGYSHAVFVPLGTSFGMRYSLFTAIEDYCKQDFLIASDSDIRIHNLKTDSTKQVELSKDIIASKEHLHYKNEKQFVDEIDKLYSYNFFGHSHVNPHDAVDTGKEITDIKPFNNPVDQYITVATGINWIKNLIRLGYTDNTEVIFTDINTQCLSFLQSLIAEWDGNNYFEFYESKMLYPHGIADLLGNREDTWSKKSDRVIDEFNNIDNWPEVWQSIRKLKYKFVPIDYTGWYDLSWIETGKNTFFNLSNIFVHIPFMIHQPVKYRIACENRIINRLTERDPNIVLSLHCRAADYLHSNPNQMLYGPVKYFNQTSLNDLRKLPWHQKDWNDKQI
jgi:hypothetical protein